MIQQLPKLGDDLTARPLPPARRNSRLSALLFAWLAMLYASAPAHAVAAYYPPLSSQVDLSQAPTDLVTPSDRRPTGEPSGPADERLREAGERLRVKSFRFSEIENAAGVDIGARVTLDLVVPRLFELDVPGLENALSVAIASGEFHAEAVLREEHATDDPENDFPFILTITPGENQFAIRFKSDVLKPVQSRVREDGRETFEAYATTPPVPELALGAGVRIQVRYTWDGDPEVRILDDAGGRPTLSLNTPVAIGDTGIVLEVTDAEIDLSRVSSAPGLPPTWIGVRFGRLAVHFINGLDVPRIEHGPDAAPPEEMAGVDLTDFSLGSGGISGSICGNLSAGPTLQLFDADFLLQRLCITFQEGSLTEGEVRGVLSEFPFFETPVGLTLALAMDGNFKVGLSPPDPARPTSAIDLEIPDVLVYHLETLSIEKKQEEFIWRTSGTLNINAISPAPEDAIKVNGLTITSDGDVVLEGGWLTLPGKKKIGFEGFNVELAEIGFGREETEVTKNWVGFTGGVELVGDLGASAKFKKLQYLWREGGSEVDTRLQGVEVAFRKPGTISFRGALDFFDDPVTHDKGFAGKVAVNLEAVKLAIDGRLIVGETNPPAPESPLPFFYIDLAASLPSGVPVFSNVSLYGITGLFSYQTTPNIVAFTTPVEWFHAHLEATAAANVLAVPPSFSAAPWKTQLDALAFGAGAILGTTSDDGFVVNAKLALTISLPGPVVMLNGAANIIKERGDLVDTSNRPNFTALAIYDGSRNSFLINIGAYYSVIDLIEAQGEAEAFFNLSDPNDWHMWIGSEPEERRIRAEVLSFLQANAYLMIDPAAFKQGATAGFDDRWNFGPLAVVMEAMFGYDVALFWRPIDIWGQVGVHGQFELSAFGVGIGLSANASLEGETPSPLEVEGVFHVSIKLPWPLPDPEASVTLHWEHERDKAPVEELVSGLAIEPRKGGPNISPETMSRSGDSDRDPLPTSVELDELCAPGASVPAGDLADIRCSKPLVPLDVLAVAAFQRDVNDVGNLGYGNPYNSSAPKLDTISDTTFKYDLNGFELMQAEKTGSPTLNFSTPLAGLYAAWPAIAGGSDPAALSLRVLSRNPVDIYRHSTFLFYENGTAGWTEWAVDTYGPQYCFDRSDDRLSTTYSQRCPISPEMVSGNDFILPPYSAFRFGIDSDVTRNTSGPDRIYRNFAIFHTEGPPLSLDPYVEVTIPASDRRPHYRNYDIGIRFNEAYMDLMYRRPGQLFQVQLLDENDRPVRSASGDVLISTDWDEAATHVPRVTEDDWLQFLRENGVPVDTVLPKDDRVFGRVSLPEAIHGGERYKVRVWLEDARLATDTRLADEDWLKANPVRFHNGNRAVVYEFPLLTSKFRTFNDLIQSYSLNYVELRVSSANLAQLATFAAAAAKPIPSPAPALSNASSRELAHFLRNALSPSGPEDVPWPQVEDWIRRAPGYSDKPDRCTTGMVVTSRECMSDVEERALRDNWNAALGAYDRIDKSLALDSSRRPLPDRLELRPIKHGANTIGFLFEAPESLDFTRISIDTSTTSLGAVSPIIVANRDNTRFFLFRISGASVQPWPDDEYTISFSLNHVVSDRYPILRTAAAASLETSAITVNLPRHRFVAETP